MYVCEQFRDMAWATCSVPFAWQVFYFVFCFLAQEAHLRGVAASAGFTETSANQQVKGIWSQHNKVGDVTITDVCTKHKATAVAMDVNKTNMVALFGYPCVGKAADRQMYPGHASRVACLRWTDDAKYLISVGSLDQAVFQWRVVESSLHRACKPPFVQQIEPRQTMQIITRADD